jgi:hypothetical protein
MCEILLWLLFCMLKALLQAYSKRGSTADRRQRSAVDQIHDVSGRHGITYVVHAAAVLPSKTVLWLSTAARSLHNAYIVAG